MVRLHLLGFTPDHKGLVFSGRRGGRAGTYWVAVDDALNDALSQLEDAIHEARGPRPAVAASRREGAARTIPSSSTPADDDDSPIGRRNALIRQASGSPHQRAEAPAARGAQQRARSDRAAAAQRPRVESKLSPREIQTFLREGRTVKDVAERAGVDEAWVDRFLGPVLEEMSGIIRATQRAHQARPRLGPSSMPIGAAVERNLIDRRASAETMESLASGWDARRTNERSWRVRLRFRHRGKRRVAEWELTPATRTVRARNELASELGWWGSGAAAREAPPVDEGEPAGEQPRPKRRAAAPAKRPATKATRGASRTKATLGASRTKTTKRVPARKTSTRGTTAKASPKQHAAAKPRKRATTPAKRGAVAKRATASAKRTASARGSSRAAATAGVRRPARRR